MITTLITLITFSHRRPQLSARDTRLHSATPLTGRAHMSLLVGLPSKSPFLSFLGAKNPCNVDIALTTPAAASANTLPPPALPAATGWTLRSLGVSLPNT
ncbi:hypothetical protein E2C01_076548 [Portunus trituberculatus]|uniref:Uncharacterized protein n=1 Tax=Portunus trituberculatus TaxID=210409 RepID=A0A5B7IJ31_PORTR|nr:hypothetical protein [Portunus trituberculatus]